jgi:hypothetical protein
MGARQAGKVVVVVLAALLLTASRCGGGDGGSPAKGNSNGAVGGQSSGGGNGGASSSTGQAPRSSPKESSGKSPGASPSTSPVASAEESGEFTALVQTLYVNPPYLVDGAYRATCSALDLQLTFQAYGTFGATAKWRVLVLDYQPSNVRPIKEGNAARGVSVRSATGTLAVGSRTTVNVSGKYSSVVSPSDFWVVVEAPVKSGNFTPTHFRCITN